LPSYSGKEKLLGATIFSRVASDIRSGPRGGMDRRSWVDIVIAICAAGGLTASTLFGVQIRASTFAASDFKTLYASTWCFAHGINAYSIENLQKVFVVNGVVQPESWYAHAPVYPWTTLAVLFPMSLLPMVPAAYVLTLLTGVLLAAAIAALMRYSATQFNLEIRWRIGIAALCVCGPLLAFSMNMGNVSVATSALCVLSCVSRREGTSWDRSRLWWVPVAALAIALLLKPHLALWCAVGMFLLPERAGRTVAVRAVAAVSAFAIVTAWLLAASGTFNAQTRAYLAMLGTESSAGASMNSASHEALPVVAQITSLNSILGFWITNSMIRGGLTCLLLLALGALLIRRTRLVDTERGALLAIGAWCSMGMLATYHRAHDASLLILLVPWVISRIRDTPLRWPAWTAVALYCGMSVSLDFPVVLRLVGTAPQHSLLSFLLLRQVALSNLLLLLVLFMTMSDEHVNEQRYSGADAQSDDANLRAA